MDNPSNPCIEDLPVEVLTEVFKYLPGQDLDSCFNVCLYWNNILNDDSFWKEHCIYEKKCHGVLNKTFLEHVCIWKQCYDKERSLFTSWDKGFYFFDKLKPNMISNTFSDYIDDFGNRWLFEIASKDITVWNISSCPKLHQVICRDDATFIQPAKDKLIMYQSDYVKILEFGHPNYDLSQAFRFIFDQEDILIENEKISKDYYTSFSRHVVIDNYFVGYYECITDIHSEKFHIWDLNSAKKVATPGIYQESLAEFLQISVNAYAPNRSFSGGLLLFGDESTDILVTIIVDGHDICQVSLFCLKQLKYVRTIAQLKSRRAWCFMKKELIAIHHFGPEHDQSRISIYRKNGELITTLNFHSTYNPGFSDELWFSGNTFLLKQSNTIIVVSNLVRGRNFQKWDINIDKNKYILGFFEPKYLLLFTKTTGFTNENSVDVVDITSGNLLFTLEELHNINSIKSWLSTSKFPGKLIVPFDDHLRVLNFK